MYAIQPATRSGGSFPLTPTSIAAPARLQRQSKIMARLSESGSAKHWSCHHHVSTWYSAFNQLSDLNKCQQTSRESSPVIRFSSSNPSSESRKKSNNESRAEDDFTAGVSAPSNELVCSEEAEVTLMVSGSLPFALSPSSASTITSPRLSIS